MSTDAVPHSLTTTSPAATPTPTHPSRHSYVDVSAAFAKRVPHLGGKGWNTATPVRGIADENARLMMAKRLPMPPPAEAIAFVDAKMIDAALQKGGGGVANPSANTPPLVGGAASSSPSPTRLPPPRFPVTEVAIVNADTVSAGLALGPDTAVLSFGNAQTPGGRYTHDGRAQEEDLCRLMPQLYPSLCSGGGGACSTTNGSSHQGLTTTTTAALYPIPTGTALLSRHLIVARQPLTYDVVFLPLHPHGSGPSLNKAGGGDAGGTEEGDGDIANASSNSPQQLPTLSVITAAMPCGASDSGRPRGGWLNSDWANSVRLTIRAVLNAAVVAGHSNLVLGAFGCGAYGNPTRPVAQLFRQVLEERGGGAGKFSFRGQFKTIVFAIIDPIGTGNLKPFREELKGIA